MHIHALVSHSSSTIHWKQKLELKPGIISTVYCFFELILCEDCSTSNDWGANCSVLCFEPERNTNTMEGQPLHIALEIKAFCFQQGEPIVACQQLATSMKGGGTGMVENEAIPMVQVPSGETLRNDVTLPVWHLMVLKEVTLLCWHCTIKRNVPPTDPY